MRTAPDAYTLAGRYRVVITKPDGSESIEEVDEPTELIERSVQLMNSLRGDGWRLIREGRTTVEEVLRMTKDETIAVGAESLGMNA